MEFYYVNDNRERLGPFSLEQLRLQPITPDTLVWSQQLGMQQWTPAGQVPQLAALFAPAPQPAPVEQTLQQPVQQAYPQQPIQQPYKQSYQPVEGESKNKMPLIIAVAVVTLVLLGALGWWLMKSNTSPETSIDDSTVVATEMTDDVESSEATVGDDFEPTEGAPIGDDVDGDVEPEALTADGMFAPRHASSGSEGFSNMVLLIERLLGESGTSVSNFSDMRALGKVTGNQIMYEHSDGVRYQFFFDKPVKTPSAQLTGIAVSRKTSTPYTQCAELQDALEDRGYYELNTHIFGNGNGMLYSPGYKGDRVYCYIYRPNAPTKDPAPRD